MPKLIDDDSTKRVKTKSYVINTTDENNNAYENNNYYDEDNDEDDNTNDEAFHIQIINEIKSVFINHFNLTHRTILEFLNDEEINSLIYTFVKY
jgi:hypothetical protein